MRSASTPENGTGVAAPMRMPTRSLMWKVPPVGQRQRAAEADDAERSLGAARQHQAGRIVVAGGEVVHARGRRAGDGGLLGAEAEDLRLRRRARAAPPQTNAVSASVTPRRSM